MGRRILGPKCPKPGRAFRACLSGRRRIGRALGATETSMVKIPATQSAIKTSKHDALLKLLRGNKGATVAQMQKATGWQPHSIRGFLSGTVKKRLGLTIQSAQGKSGQRHYQIVGR